MGKGLAFEEMTAYEVGDYDASLTRVTHFEANYDHSVAFEAATPAVTAIFRADSTGSDETWVASRADVVVTRLSIGDFRGTLWAVISM